MRMTDKIMQSNALYNINNNKLLQDKLSVQMETQKKLTRPSDDPVVAIRALRLRTNVAELTQFKDKNAGDAKAWLTTTSDALSTANSILEDADGLIPLMNGAANKQKTPSDLAIIMQQIKSLTDEYYSTGNEDFAGRYIFTGYRTDTPLSFTDEVEEKNLTYNITEQVKLAQFDSINYTDMDKVEGLGKENYTSKGSITEDEVSSGDIYRLRLSYDEVKAGKLPTISYVSNQAANPPQTTDLIGGSGVTMTEVSLKEPSPNNPYQQILDANKAGKDLAIFVPETGEILLSDKTYKGAMGNVNDKTEIRVNYEKEHWEKGDLRPEHYFSCTATEQISGQPDQVTSYNASYLTNSSDGQNIEYDVGYNQKIAVNSKASDVFPHSMNRYVDDLSRAVTELTAIDKTVKDMESLFSGLSESSQDYQMVRDQLDAAKKAYSSIREKVHNMFGKAITVMQKGLDNVNLAVTDNGTRSARLDLISNRLLSQKTTFETLKSENEDVNIAEVGVQLKGAALTYEAALSAAGKIMQTSLMNYI